MAGGWQGWGQKDHNGIAVDRVCLACGIRAEKVSGCVYDNHYTETPDGERLARLEIRVEHVERAVEDIRNDIRDLRPEMERNFLWTVGIIITTWVSLMITIVVK
jgi:hypothetical protein